MSENPFRHTPLQVDPVRAVFIVVYSLPPKEQVWGLNLNGEQVAYTQGFLEKNPLHNTTVGGKPVLVAWFDEYETLGVFSREIDGHVIEVAKIDVYGKPGCAKCESTKAKLTHFLEKWNADQSVTLEFVDMETADGLTKGVMNDVFDTILRRKMR